MNTSFSRIQMAIVAAAAMTAFGVTPASAAILTFNNLTPAGNATARASWLAAVGVASPDHLVNFESGFTDGQNISGVTGLFPAGFLIADTGPLPAEAIIEDDSISGSNPVGVFALEHDDELYLELNFSANPVDYVGFLGIDHGPMNGIVTFVGGGTAPISLDSTMATGNTAEFFGIYRNDMPRIVRLELGTEGDGWGIDNIEYGSLDQTAAVPEPSTILMFAGTMLGLICCRGLRPRPGTRTI